MMLGISKKVFQNNYVWGEVSPVKYNKHSMMAGTHVMSLAEASNFSCIALKRMPKVLTHTPPITKWIDVAPVI